jgi:hypothetical protein
MHEIMSAKINKSICTSTKNRGAQKKSKKNRGAQKKSAKIRGAQEREIANAKAQNLRPKKARKHKSEELPPGA